MIKGLHHAGISVKDLDRSVAFYCDILGMELLRQGDFNGGSMDRITALTNTRGRAAMLRVGQQYLELFEFALPTPMSPDHRRPMCDHGISHFCIEVTNIEQEFERLKAAGVEFHCTPQIFGSMRATYARDPDGNALELLETSASRD